MLTRRAIVDVDDAESLRGDALAVADERVERAHHERDERKDFPIEPLRLVIAPRAHRLVDLHLHVEALRRWNDAGAAGAQILGELEAAAAVEYAERACRVLDQLRDHVRRRFPLDQA